MPILRGTVTFSRFLVRLKRPSRDAQWLSSNLHAHGFEPLQRKSDDDRAAGFVELEDQDAVDFHAGQLHYGEYALFSYRIDSLKVSGVALRAELEKWRRDFERDQGRPPGRAEKAESRATLRQMLRSKATPSTKIHDIGWNIKTGDLQIWSSSRKVIDEIEAALKKALDIELEPVALASAAQAMDIKDEALSPTAPLSWPDFEKGEARHG